MILTFLEMANSKSAHFVNYSYRSFCQFSLKVMKVPDRSSGSFPGPPGCPWPIFLNSSMNQSLALLLHCCANPAFFSLLNLIVAHSTVLIPHLNNNSTSPWHYHAADLSVQYKFFLNRTEPSNRSPSLGMGPSVKSDFSTICLQKPARKGPLDGKAGRDLCYSCGEECSSSWFHPHYLGPSGRRKKFGPQEYSFQVGLETGSFNPLHLAGFATSARLLSGGANFYLIWLPLTR